MTAFSGATLAEQNHFIPMLFAAVCPASITTFFVIEKSLLFFAELGKAATQYVRNHSAEAEAHSLFARLRDIDKQGCEVFYVRMPRREGIGLAVYNRMIKAAGHEVVTL